MHATVGRTWRTWREATQPQGEAELHKARSQEVTIEPTTFMMGYCSSFSRFYKIVMQ